MYVAFRVQTMSSSTFIWSVPWSRQIHKQKIFAVKFQILKENAALFEKNNDLLDHGDVDLDEWLMCGREIRSRP
jgi:hypothetical protein